MRYCTVIFLLLGVVATAVQGADVFAAGNDIMAPEITLRDDSLRFAFAESAAHKHFDRLTSAETSPNRLTSVHTHVIRALLRQIYSDFSERSFRLIDVGVGDNASTTFGLLRLAERILGASVSVIGFDKELSIVEEANGRAVRENVASRIHFETVVDFYISKNAPAVFLFNVMRYYPDADLPEIVKRLGNAVEAGGLLIIGNNDPIDHFKLAAVVYQKDAGIMVRRQLVFGLTDQLTLGFVNALQGLIYRDPAIIAFRSDVSAVYGEVQRRELFDFAQGMERRGYVVDRTNNLVIKTVSPFTPVLQAPVIPRKEQVYVRIETGTIPFERAL